MKSLHKFLLVVLPLLTACQPEPPMDAIKPMEEGCFVSVIRSEQGDFSALSQFTRGMDIGDVLFFLDKKATFQASAISYKTIDPHGNPVLASGMVYHPLNVPSKGTIEIMPIAALKKDEGPSDLFFAIEGILVYTGYTVIVPDLLGFGISHDMEYPFLMAENTGRVVYDMRRAAAEFLRQEFQYELPVKTIIAGYSLGGFVSLAAQKYYETHHAHNVKIERVYSGGGVYDLTATLKDFATYTFADYPAIPGVVVAFNHYYKLNLDFSRIFTGELLENWEEWLNRSLSSHQLNDKIPKLISMYMHPDFFLPFEEQNSEFQKLHACFGENSLAYSWTPKAPISFVAPYFDSYVGSSSIKLAVQNFRNAGCRVDFQRVTGDHNEVGYFFVIKLLIFALGS